MLNSSTCSWCQAAMYHKGDLMTDDNSWKEQLAFVSSYILVSGLAVLKLWPLAAAYQTDMNVNFWTFYLPSLEIHTALWVFLELTVVLSMALTAIALAIVHILCRGLWLAFFSGPSTNPLVVGASRLLDRSRQVTYEAAFFLLCYLGLLAILGVVMVVYAGLERTLMSLSLSPKAADWTARSLVAVAGGLLVFIALIKFSRLPNVTQVALIRTPRLVEAATTLFFLWFMWLLVIQTCYTADMNVAGRVFHRSRSDLIEVSLTLGGSTSAINRAQLKLADSRGMLLSDLSPQDLGDGHYLSTIPSRDLPGGRYQITLEYPHSSFDSSYPFLHRRIAERRWFLVMP